MLADGDCEGALSRAYYNAFHCARALLLMDGLEAKTHSGTAHMVNQHFVRTNRLSPEAQDAIEKAERFGDAVRQILSQGGYL